RNAQGQEAHAGGLDYILSDEGSGYDIGLRLLKAVASCLDGRAAQTILVDRLYQHLNITDLPSLYEVIYQHYVTKPAIASLAQLVGEAAVEDDQVAVDILNHSVNELLKMIGAVTQRLSLAE